MFQTYLSKLLSGYCCGVRVLPTNPRGWKLLVLLRFSKSTYRNYIYYCLEADTQMFDG